jgi:hypothetical protein
MVINSSLTGAIYRNYLFLDGKHIIISENHGIRDLLILANAENVAMHVRSIPSSKFYTKSPQLILGDFRGF